MRNRLVFIVTIGAIIVVLAILGLVVYIEGDDEDQGSGTGPSPESAPAHQSLVVTETPMAGLART